MRLVPSLQGFEVFRADETLCDVVLVPGDSDETFRVHRVIMASSSDYFKAMFTGGGNRKNDSNYPKHWAEAEFSICFGAINMNCMLFKTII